MTAAEWIVQRRNALELLSAYAALREMAGDLGAAVTIGTLGVRGSDITAAEEDVRASLPLALNALEAVLGMVARGAVGARARGDGDEERRWLDLTIVIESALRADLFQRST